MTATVITRELHGISRKDLSPAALRTLYGLKDAGFDAYLVGGAVRDLLLGMAPKDFDIATNATPEQIQRVFRSCRLVGRRFVIAHVRFGSEIIEVTTFRGTHDADGDRAVEEGGRILRDNVFGNIEEDALRRDFTANALYYSINEFTVLDFCGAIDDLRKRQFRLIGDPETRYREDPVRMLRVARLAAKLEFAIEFNTEAAIAGCLHTLSEIPPARLFDEVQKLFLTGHAIASFNELQRLQLWSALFPSIRSSAIQKSQAFFLAALQSTDQRLAEGKSVTPAFLFAAIGWLQIRHAHDPLNLSYEQRGPTFDQALEVCSERVALPNRYAVQVREIWELQSRLVDTTVSRARRLLVNPRFRAAYDFLVLRATSEPELQEWVDRWSRAQHPDVNLDVLFKRVTNKLIVDSAKAIEAKPVLASIVAIDQQTNHVEASTEVVDQANTANAPLPAKAKPKRRRRKTKPEGQAGSAKDAVDTNDARPSSVAAESIATPAPTAVES